jgi:hypothetical protein
MSPTVTKRSLAEMCEGFLLTRERAKKLYQEADEMLQEIAEEIDPGEEIKFKDEKGNKRAYVLIDNFEGQTERWAHACARRYDVIDIPKE